MVPRNLGAELDSPTGDGLVADVDPSLRQHLLDIAEAEGEAEIEPDRMADDVHRKPMPNERGRTPSPPLTDLMRPQGETS